jgi:DNA topoisomerase I
MSSGNSLRFTSDQAPGIRRVGTKRFRYVGPDGPVVAHELDRIRALTIPPAWTDVWICADPSGHLQATGRDARGRKQSRYHAAFRSERDDAKFAQLAAFGSVLPRLRRSIDRDLALRRPSEQRQTALVVQLLDKTAIRVGNEEYRRTNGSYGLSTLRPRHAKVAGSDVVFTFPGKSGQHHRVELHDRRLARLIGQCQDLPGQRLFSYIDVNGDPHVVTSEMVNGYIRNATEADFTAKTFRNWIGSTIAAEALVASASEPTKKALLDGIDRAASVLGNTRTVCRSSYVHPIIQSLYLEGVLLDRWNDGPDRASRWLDRSERRTLHVIEAPVGKRRRRSISSP